MAQITNPEAIRFCNETVRPLAELIRSVHLQINALRTIWYAGMNATFANSADTVEDGREAEGVSRLIAGDVTNFVAQAIKTATGETDAWNTEIVQKPCVRQLP